MKEIRVIGITLDEHLVPLNSTNAVRGLRLRGLIISAHYVEWFRKNEAVFRETFSRSNGGGIVMIMDFGPCAWGPDL